MTPLVVYRPPQPADRSAKAEAAFYETHADGLWPSWPRARWLLWRRPRPLPQAPKTVRLAP